MKSQTAEYRLTECDFAGSVANPNPKKSYGQSRICIQPKIAISSRIIDSDEGWPKSRKLRYGRAGYHQKFKFLNVIYITQSCYNGIHFEENQII